MWGTRRPRGGAAKRKPRTTRWLSGVQMERENGFEPSTLALANLRGALHGGAPGDTATQGGGIPGRPPVAPEHGRSRSAPKRTAFVTRLLPEPAAGAGSEPEQLLTVQQVAEFLGVCRATVYRLCTEGRLPHTRVLNSIRFRPPDIRRWLAQAAK